MQPLKPPAEVYADVRRENPGTEIGDCWEGIGTCLGSDVWADPERYRYGPSAYEILWQASKAKQDHFAKVRSIALRAAENLRRREELRLGGWAPTTDPQDSARATRLGPDTPVSPPTGKRSGTRRKRS